MIFITRINSRKITIMKIIGSSLVMTLGRIQAKLTKKAQISYSFDG